MSPVQASRGALNNMIFDSCIYHSNVFVDMPPCQTMSNQYVQVQVQIYVCLKPFIQIVTAQQQPQPQQQNNHNCSWVETK